MLHLKYKKVKIVCPPAPRSEDGSAGGGQGEECRAVRALVAPHRPNTWRAEPSRNFPFLFRIFFRGARKRKIVRENFCEVLAVAIAEAGGARAYDLVQSHHVLRACVSRGSVQKKLEFQPKGTANLQFQHFGKRLPRRYAPRQAREARQTPILQRFATLRVAKRKRLGFGFGSSPSEARIPQSGTTNLFSFRQRRNLEAIIFNILTA